MENSTYKNENIERKHLKQMRKNQFFEKICYDWLIDYIPEPMRKKCRWF